MELESGTGRGKLGAAGSAMLFSHAGGIDVARFVDRQGGDFFLRRAVEDEAFSAGRDAIDQAAAVRSGDQIAFVVEGQHADVGFVTLEKYGVLAFRRDAENFVRDRRWPRRDCRHRRGRDPRCIWCRDRNRPRNSRRIAGWVFAVDLSGAFAAER